MKQALRNTFRELERNRPSDEIASASAAICRRVIELDEFRNAHSVGAYLSLPTEVQTDGIIAACLESGKEVCIPYYIPDSGRYGMSRYTAETELKVVDWELREPVVPEPVDISRLDLILVPGLAFDINGTRLGHGGGHYDRLLSGVTAFRLGLAFQEQVVDNLPCDAHDEPVDAIMTGFKYFHDLR